MQHLFVLYIGASTLWNGISLVLISAKQPIYFSIDDFMLIVLESHF